MYKAYEISPDIYWVGALEWNERYIHGFSMPQGSTNNAYLILDEKITLIDTCLGSMSDQLLARISDVIDPAQIDIIISSHSEKDHAGSIDRILEVAPHAQIVTSSPKGLSILQTYYGKDHTYLGVKNGEELSIGKRTLKFIHTPMVHWPDNMVTYSTFDEILFSNDAFGQFIATSKRFDDEVDTHEILKCAKKYFANIVAPFAKQTKRALDAVSGLTLKMVAPAHGIIWRSHINDILDAYTTWCTQEPTRSAVVAYSSMYGATERIAAAITEAFMSCGIEVRLFNLDISDISDIMTAVMDAKYIAIGSSTQNMTVLAPVGQFLTYLKGLAPKGRYGIAFGSYGWASAATLEISQIFETLDYKQPIEPLTVEWNEDENTSDHIFDTICTLVKNG